MVQKFYGIPESKDPPFEWRDGLPYCSIHKTRLLGRLGTSAGGGMYCLDCFKYPQLVIENYTEKLPAERLENIQVAALNFVEILTENMPESVERGAAIIKVGEILSKAASAIHDEIAKNL